MAYVTIIAVLAVPDADLPEKSMEGDDPDTMLELGVKQFKDKDQLRFITCTRDVTAVAVLEGADPSLWPDGITTGSF